MQLYMAKLNLEDIEVELSTLGQGKEAKKARSELAVKKKALTAQMKRIRAALSSTLQIITPELDSCREAHKKAHTSSKENISPCAASNSSSPEDHSSDDECVPTPTCSHHHRVLFSPSPEVGSSGEAPMAMDDNDPPFLNTLPSTMTIVLHMKWIWTTSRLNLLTMSRPRFKTRRVLHLTSSILSLLGNSRRLVVHFLIIPFQLIFGN
jgi:hypothetical protein